MKALGSTRKHLEVLGRNPEEGKHWEALGSTRKPLDALGSTRKLLEELRSTGKHKEAPER